jgi:peptidoglycan hydrolase-like protein with peptidoglycan-binding domain
MASGGSLAARPDAGDSNSRRSNAVTFADCQWAWRILRQWAWRVLRQQRGASCASGAAIRAALGNFSRRRQTRTPAPPLHLRSMSAPSFKGIRMFEDGRTKIKKLCFISIALFGAAACDTDGTDGSGVGNSISMDPSEMRARLASLNHDVSEGSRGAEVRALQEYLRTYGYFPNDDLTSAYPTWRPIIDRGPDEWGAFDRTTTNALRAMQANTGLPQSGIADVATRNLLQMPRCRVPDGIPRLDPSDKFAPQGSVRGSRNLSWRLVNTDDVDPEVSLRAAQRAFQSWQNQTSLTFASVGASMAPDLIIVFRTAEGFCGSGALGCAQYPDSGSVIALSTEVAWTESLIESVLVHEIGHSLGLQHSAFSDTVMYPFNSGRTVLNLDDKVGISAIYDTWQVGPGEAIDIGIGSIPNLFTGPGPTWAIGTNAMGGGNFGIFQATQAFAPDGRVVLTGWVQSNGNAVRIAVAPDFRPWVVNAAGEIYRRTGISASSGGWQLMPGAATDIGVGGPGGGTPWAIGTNSRGGGNFGIFRWNGSAWEEAPGTAVRITVDSAGKPWVVNAAGQIYRRTANSVTSGVWEELPGRARDIGIGNGNYPWIVSTTPVGADFEVRVWNEQPCLNTGGVPGCGPAGDAELLSAPGAFGWRTVPAVAGRAIAVGPDGQPWVINASGSILLPAK